MLNVSFHWEEIPANGEKCTACGGLIITSGYMYGVQTGESVDTEFTLRNDSLICKTCYECLVESESKA